MQYANVCEIFMDLFIDFVEICAETELVHTPHDIKVKRWLNSLIFNIAQAEASAQGDFAVHSVAQQQAMY